MLIFKIRNGMYQSPAPTDDAFIDSSGNKINIDAIIDLEGGIDAIVEKSLEAGKIYVCWPIEDGPLPDNNTLNYLSYFIESLINEGKIILTHCAAGINRASLVNGRTLIAMGMKPIDAITLIRQQRDANALSNQNFYDYLMQQTPGI